MERIKAMEFFMEMIRANCEHIAVENPVGIMNSAYRVPDQIIQPYYFAESTEDKENYVTKRTCLWLKNLPPLKRAYGQKPDNEKMFGKKPSGKVNTWTDVVRHSDGGKERSKTFPGVAKAMASQWGEYLEQLENKKSV